MVTQSMSVVPTSLALVFAASVVGNIIHDVNTTPFAANLSIPASFSTLRTHN